MGCVLCFSAGMMQCREKSVKMYRYLRGTSCRLRGKWREKTCCSDRALVVAKNKSIVGKNALGFGLYLAEKDVRQGRGATMNFRYAVHILMQSPMYFRVPLPDRLKLVKEYCQAMNSPNAFVNH
jgi:hypothetical protein